MLVVVDIAAGIASSGISSTGRRQQIASQALHWTVGQRPAARGGVVFMARSIAAIAAARRR